jgi:hypothetical protein
MSKVLELNLEMNNLNEKMLSYYYQNQNKINLLGKIFAKEEFQKQIQSVLEEMKNYHPIYQMLNLGLILIFLEFHKQIYKQ